MKIIQALNLNNDPTVAVEGSMLYARNVMADGSSIVSDNGNTIIESMNKYDIVGHIVGVDNIIYFFTKDNKIIEYNEVTKVGKEIPTGWKYNGGEIDGCVTTNISGEKILTIAEFLTKSQRDKTIIENNVADEDWNKLTPITDDKSIDTPIIAKAPTDTTGIAKPVISGSASQFDSTKLDVIKDISGKQYDVLGNSKSSTESSTNISEAVKSGSYVADKVSNKFLNDAISADDSFYQINREVVKTLLVPIKHINLSYCKATDDETIYTQAPEIPIVNLYQDGTYAKTIPYGTYVFYIRFRIRKDVYTSWHVVSNPMFAGVQEETNALQGTFRYINLHKDSSQSFIFGFSSFNQEAIKNYDKFQLGFVISHDDSNNARAWKEFDINILKGGTQVYFDYDEVTEVDLEEMMSSVYDINNVRNVTSFRNKLYISNYIESKIDIPRISDIISLKVGCSDDAATSDYSEGVVKYKDIEIVKDINNRYFKTKDGVRNLLDLGLTNDNGGLIINLETNDDGTLKTTTTSHTNKAAYTFEVKSSGIDIGDTTLLSLAVVTNFQHANGIKFDVDALNKSTSQDAFVGLSLSSYDNPDCEYIALDSSRLSSPWKDLDLPCAFISVDSNLESAYRGAFDSSIVDKDLIGSTYCKWFAIYGSEKPYGLHTQNLVDKNGQRISSSVVDDWVCYIDLPNSNNETALVNYIKNKISRFSVLQTSYCYITDSSDNQIKESVAKVLDSDTYCVIGKSTYDDNDPRTFDGLTDTEKKTRITNSVKKFFNKENSFLGIKINDDKTFTFCFKIGDTEINSKSLTVVTKRYDYNVNSVIKSGDGIDESYSVDCIISTIETNVSLDLEEGTLTIPDNISTESTKITTLQPWSNYDIYCHFIDKKGIVTNGVKVGQVKTGKLNLEHSRYELTYKIGAVAKDIDYIGMFLSLANVGNKVCQLFDITKSTNAKVDEIEDVYYASCLEADTLLYALNDNITVMTNDGFVLTNNATYLSSGSTNPVVGFGNVGLIRFKVEQNKDKFDHTKNPILFIVIKSVSTNDNPILHRCSGYIELKKTDAMLAVPNGFYWSYLCFVQKPRKFYSDWYYVSGNEVTSLKKNQATDDNPSASKEISMNNPTTVLDSSVTPNLNYSGYNIYADNARAIHSNFNLNWLSLTTELTTKTFVEGEGKDKIKHLASGADSSQLSFMYELKGMFKDFTSDTYSVYNPYAKTEFNNTIRMSNTLADESVNNAVYYFYPTDYYNVPTDRGIITKLFHISNVIYIHTESGFFKFDGNQTLETTDKDITLKNADVFASGLQQLLDSQYGYAGLSDKHSGVITFDSYFFYDAKSYHIFSYAGQGQFSLIDSDVWKLLQAFKATECYTIADIQNNRVFFDLYNGDNNICLSYNYGLKRFISIHDLTLKNSFNSQIICYSYYNKLLSLFTDTDLYRVTNIDKLNAIPSVNDSLFKIADKKYTEIAVLIFAKNAQRDSVDSVQYIASVIKGNLFDWGLNIPKNNRDNPVEAMIIDTDNAKSNIVENNVDDYARPNSLLDYKGFKYDRGFWTSNYFRNILNADNSFNYENDDAKERIKRNFVDNDQNSLVYGRYFIISLKLKAPFKFEAIDINTNNY